MFPYLLLGFVSEILLLYLIKKFRGLVVLFHFQGALAAASDDAENAHKNNVAFSRGFLNITLHYCLVNGFFNEIKDYFSSCVFFLKRVKNIQDVAIRHMIEIGVPMINPFGMNLRSIS